MTTTRAQRAPIHRRGGAARLFLVARWALLWVAWSGGAHAGGSWGAGQPLADALNALRNAGLEVSFSSILVRPNMVVHEAPRSSEPRRALDELLVPHGLAVREGLGGALLVIRAPRSRDIQPARATSTFTTEPAASIPSMPFAVDGQDDAPMTALNDAIDVTSNRDQRPVRPLAVSVQVAQLEGQPSARDPWSLLRLAPGVTTERINVGGSESGRQMRFAAPGTTSDENQFSLDGVNATDMAAVGSSAVYYDFDQLEEVRIGTGGADVRTAVAGVSIELVTKRGADVARGSARVLASGDAGPLTSITGSAVATAPNRQPGNRVVAVEERGGEFGGLLVPGHLWGWGAVSETAIDAQAVNGDPDNTRLAHRAFKLNAQWGPSSSGVASINESNKTKPSRGAGPTRTFASTWRQSGPSQVAKVEATRLFGDAMVLTGQASVVSGGFRLTSNGGEGPNGGEALLDADGIWKGGMLGGPSDRDSRRFQLEGSRFQSWRGVDHEIRFGGSTRRYSLVDALSWPGPRQAYNVACENYRTCGGFGTGDWVIFERVGSPASDLDYQAAWIQDRIRTRRWTVDLGVRFDRQRGANRPGAVAANPAMPDVLPAVTSPGVDGGFAWKTVSPRLGFTVSLGNGRTRLRSSLGRFAEQLSTEDVARLDPVEQAEASFLFDDQNGDNIWQANEPIQWQETIGGNALTPHASRSPNRTDAGFQPELTDEWVVGVERSVGSNLLVSLDVTVRRIASIADERLLVMDRLGRERAVQSADYALDYVFTIPRPDGTWAEAPVFALTGGLTPTGGTLLTNGDRERHYAGVTLRVQRRRAERWSFRGHVTYGQADWRVPSSFRLIDDPTDIVGGGDNNGGLHAERVGVQDVAFLNSTWSGHFEAQVRVAPLRPWGFNLAANMTAREGFPLPYYFEVRSIVDGIRRQAQVTNAVDEYRTDSVVTFDLRAEKSLPLGKRLAARGLRATAALDVFNLLDERPVLRREVNLSRSRFDDVDSTLAPRVARFGVRLYWH